MSKRTKMVIFSILFMFIFVYLGKNSNLTRFKKLYTSFLIARKIIFGGLDVANAKNNKIILGGVYGFEPPISRPNPNNNPALGRARQNISKGLFPPANKLPRAPSGFRAPTTPYKPVKKQGLYGGVTSFVNNNSGGSGDDSNINLRFSKKSSAQSQNLTYFNQAQKKKKKNFRRVNKERVV